MKYLACLLLLFVLGCNPPANGPVSAKRHIPSSVIYTVGMTGNGGTYLLPIFIAESWELDVSMNGTTYTYGVPEDTYNKVKLGDTYKETE